ncbi:679_t:CDS:2, partial [Cetraspora pellucida]
MVDRISEMSDLTLSLDGWTDVSNNFIYAFLLHKFGNINEIINIEEFSSIRHTASNLLVAIINSLQNVSIDFKNNIKTGLQTFCETQWYSLSKVCLSVQTYKNGFQTCLEYNNNFPNECPFLSTKIKEIITSRRHFFENEQFTTVLRYIVDAIAKLESNNTTLGDIFAKLLFIYKKLKSSEFEDFDYGLIDHAKNIVNFRAKEFDEPIYYLAFFLNPKFCKIALSKKLTYDDIVAGALKILALKIFAIRSYSARVEQLFSHIGITKTKIRNRLATSTLKMISQINLALSIEVPKKNSTKKL